MVAAFGESIGTKEFAGAVHVIYGSRDSGLIADGNQMWHQDTSGVAGAAHARDMFGSFVATGDFNSDGFDDLAISALGESVGSVDGAGAVHIIYGTTEGLSAAGDQFWHQDNKGILGMPDGNENFGQALAVGDFDSNGYDDLAISVPDEDIKDVRDAGMVHVLFGGGSGLSTKGAAVIREGVGGIESGSGGLWGIAGDRERLGFALAAGDFNENGNLDGFKNHLIIGVPASIQDLMTEPGTRTGLVHVLWPGLNAFNHWNSFITLRP